MEVRGEFHDRTALPPGKNSVPIEQEAGWTPQQVWIFWRIQKCLALAVVRTPCRLAPSLVTVLTTLSRLSNSVRGLEFLYACLPHMNCKRKFISCLCTVVGGLSIPRIRSLRRAFSMPVDICARIRYETAEADYEKIKLGCVTVSVMKLYVSQDLLCVGNRVGVLSRFNWSWNTNEYKELILALPGNLLRLPEKWEVVTHKAHIVSILLLQPVCVLSRDRVEYTRLIKLW